MDIYAKLETFLQVIPVMSCLQTHPRTTSHSENRKSYVRMLFVDCSSAFNTIIMDILVTKLSRLQIPTPHFLTNQPQTVRFVLNFSSMPCVNIDVHTSQKFASVGLLMWCESMLLMLKLYEVCKVVGRHNMVHTSLLMI